MWLEDPEQTLLVIRLEAHLSLLVSVSIRVINAGKSMLNEDQASCEKLFVRRPTGKHRNSTLLEDNGVSQEQISYYQNKGMRDEMFGERLSVNNN